MPSNEDSRSPARQIHMRIPLDVDGDMELLAEDAGRTKTTEFILALRAHIRNHRRRLERIKAS